MLLDDTFWELEHFQSKEPWAVNPVVRRSIAAQYEYRRSLEEIHILELDVTRYVNWHISRLNSVEKFIKSVVPGSAIYSLVLRWGAQSMQALRSLECLNQLTLETEDVALQAIAKTVKGTACTDVSNWDLDDVWRGFSEADDWEIKVLLSSDAPETLDATDGTNDHLLNLHLALQRLTLDDPTESIENFAERHHVALELDFEDALVVEPSSNS